ncbi:MAG: hypothetical protein ACJ73E_00375 [Mycobacteriales bacterium]
MPADVPAGLRPPRLLRLARQAVLSCGVDLSGLTVLTEAATGPYVLTPVLAALGRAARVHAVTRATRHGTVEEVRRRTAELAALAGVADRIEVRTGLTPELAATADVVTNSGHLRPLDARLAGWLRPDAVVPLMFEAWEIDLGRDDVDLAALRNRGIRFAGTNERNPAVGVFGFLGPMAVRLLTDAAVAVHGSRIGLLCDNPFRDFLLDGLTAAGATVQPGERLSDLELAEDTDAVLVALRPTGAPVLSDADVHRVAAEAPTAVLAQFWGDLPRQRCADAGVPVVPAAAPQPGHMGVLPSAVGPEPVVRLQAGGLRVAAVLRKPRERWTEADRSFVDEC